MILVFVSGGFHLCPTAICSVQGTTLVAMHERISRKTKDRRALQSHGILRCRLVLCKSRYLKSCVIILPILYRAAPVIDVKTFQMWVHLSR